MDNVYIKKDDLFEYKATYELFSKLFKNQDLISIDDLIVKIEDLSDEIENLEEKIKDLENTNDDYWDEDGYMERTRFGI